MIKRAFKYRFYPTPEQEQLLAQTFGCTRYVYNSILKWRTDQFYNEKKKIGYKEANAHLTELKQDPELSWLREVSSVPLQQAIRHQQTAFKNFFEGRAKYPTFKSKKHQQSITLTQSAFSVVNGKVYIAKNKEPLNISWSRELPSTPTGATISKDSAGRYFISLLCEVEEKELPFVKAEIGVDIGIKDLIVTSTGERFGNPRHTAKYAAKLAKAQKRLAKKKLGSNNRAKAKLKVAKIHAKIRDCRNDATHKLTHRLIQENQLVCAESLNVKGMIKNPKLSKHIADANFGEMLRQLQYKAEATKGTRTFVQIGQFFPSSKRCSCCGNINPSLTLSDRSWTCGECHTVLDRDHNAALNVLAEGISVLACGVDVRP